MIIGVPRDVRPSEYRVGLTPAGTDALLRRGHTVYVERGAGAGAPMKRRVSRRPADW